MDNQIPGEFRPWRRYWARWLDMSFYSVLWYLFVKFFFHRYTTVGGISQMVINTAAGVALMLLLEPLLLNRFGATLGKAVFGIRITQWDGTRMTVRQGFSRTWAMWRKGMGFSIPIYNIFTMVKSYQRCVGGCVQPWDRQDTYTLKDTRVYRWIVFAGLILAFRMTPTVVAEMAYLPPNRGDLTVLEFAENFDYLAGYYGYNIGASQLDVNGKWMEAFKPEYQHVDMLAGTRPEFSYVMDQGYIKEISFEMEKKNYDDCMSPYNVQMTEAVLAYAGAQNAAGWSLKERKQIQDQILNSGFQNIHIIYGSVAIDCTRECRGYTLADAGTLVLIPEKGRKENYYKIKFTMKKE